MGQLSKAIYTIINEIKNMDRKDKNWDCPINID
jgi:hypothetical protein